MININFTLTYIEPYLLFVNITTFLLYAFDKLQAIRMNKNISRVSELSLLTMTLLGGSIGAIISMILFRHKIKKLSFIIKYIMIIVIQAIFIYYFMIIYS